MTNKVQKVAIYQSNWLLIKKKIPSELMIPHEKCYWTKAKSLARNRSGAGKWRKKMSKEGKWKNKKHIEKPSGST